MNILAEADVYEQLAPTTCCKTNKKKRTPTVPRSQKKRTWKSQRKNKVKHEKDKEEEQEENKERCKKRTKRLSRGRNMTNEQGRGTWKKTQDKNEEEE